MKRLMLVMTLTALLLLAACGVTLNKDDLDPTPYNAEEFDGGVSMTAEKGVVSPDTPSVTLNIVNTLDKDCVFGMEYALEVYLDEAWYVVPPKEAISVNAIAQVLEPGGETQLEVSLADAYGTLPEGRYRYVKTFSVEDGVAAAAAVFDIVKK